MEFLLIAGVIGIAGYYFFSKPAVAEPLSTVSRQPGTPLPTAGPVTTGMAPNPILQLLAGQMSYQGFTPKPIVYGGTYYGMASTTDTTDTLNTVLTYMKKNPSAHAMVPSGPANWLAAHSVDIARLSQ